MKNILYLIFLLPLAVNAQTWTGNTIEFVHPTLGINGDYTAMYRDDTQSDATVLKVRMGDEYSSSFQIGYNYYVDGQWYTTFSLDGWGNGYIKGNLAIGTTTPGGYMLAVAGKIAADGEVRVFNAGTTNFPDYVFDPSYKLQSLGEIEKYVRENKHLPEVPTAKEIEKDGMSLNEMNVILLKKVEELTLHLIEMKKENDAMKTRVEILEKKK